MLQASILRPAPSAGRRQVLARLAALSALPLLGTAAAPALAGPSVHPTGTTRYDPRRAHGSYVLFTGGDNRARLIDLNGHVVREWADAAAHATAIDPALNGGRKGHVLVTLSQDDGRGTDLVPGRPAGRVTRAIGELDWDGKLVWQFGEHAPGGLARQHHDWGRLPNGHTIVLANETRPLPGFRLPQLLDDVVYEVDADGRIVWTWKAGDHLHEFGFTKAQLALVRATDDPDYLHFNNLKRLGENRWFDAGDRRFAPDNLIVDARNANFIAIIERRSGKVAWTLGPNYPAIPRGVAGRRVPRPVDQISGQHDAHLIPAGLPGAGHLLVFDNQGPAGYPAAPLPTTGGSRVLEIDPVTRQVVWQYTGEDSGAPAWTFRSTHISAARRLPNGNTFIDEGQSGRLFQVTPEGEIVWEYVNPYPRRGTDPLTGRPTLNAQLYRAQPVPYDWAPEGTPRSEEPVALR